MKISKKAYYGLRALVGLAHTGEISARALASEESLPEDYLQKILQQLKKSGLVASEKGVSGGYSLARDPRDISVWEVILSLDGKIISFAPPKITRETPYPKLTHCQTNLAWRKLSEAIENTLSNISISSLIQKSEFQITNTKSNSNIKPLKLEN